MTASEMQATVESAALFTELRLLARTANDDTLRAAIAVLKGASAQGDGVVALAECPPGLFLFRGTLCFRSEYATTLENPRRHQPDAYVVESGEYFWGGAKTTEERSRLLILPLAPARADGEG